MTSLKSLIPSERIEKSILMIRGQKVLIDNELADLYAVETIQLKRAVRRNIDRFPDDFMFQLTREELNELRHHFDTSRWAPISFSPNFCGICIFGRNQLFVGEWNSLEDNGITKQDYACDWLARAAISSTE
jgi:hypothetical protein